MMRSSIKRLTVAHVSARRARALVVVILVVSSCVALPATVRGATVAQLKAQLAALRQEAAPAGDAFEAAVTKLEDTQYRIKKTDARIKAASKKLKVAEDALGARADALYREGGDLGVFEFVFGATSWEEFVTRIDLITIVAMTDADLIATVKDTRTALQADRVSLVEDAKVEKVEVAEKSATYKVLQAKLAAKRVQYDKVLAAIAAQSGGKHPPGPNGMVFPVRGIHYYRNTWGAPRSGGRTHKGTDIMSPKGTPVVAVVSGRARPHWNSLGGKSITLTGDNGWYYYYAHLNGYAVGNVRVKAGQVIGYVGNTGNAAGGANHLHFGMGPHGRWVNPYPYLLGME
jgi:murein DD-endopeptidase MepM/ murein hydrolase activator NlpD